MILNDPQGRREVSRAVGGVLRAPDSGALLRVLPCPCSIALVSDPLLGEEVVGHFGRAHGLLGAQHDDRALFRALKRPGQGPTSGYSAPMKSLQAEPQPPLRIRC